MFNDFLKTVAATTSRLAGSTEKSLERQAEAELNRAAQRLADEALARGQSYIQKASDKALSGLFSALGPSPDDASGS